jgi:hypothetical protein
MTEGPGVGTTFLGGTDATSEAREDDEDVQGEQCRRQHSTRFFDVV